MALGDMRDLSLKNLIFLVLFVTVICASGCFKTSRGAPESIAEKYDGKVVLYSTAWCGYCEKTREVFDQRNIKYIELDIEKSSEGKSEFDRLNGRGIPLVVVKGRVVEGYAPKAVLNIYSGKE